MEETGKVTVGEKSPTTSTIDVDGLSVTVNTQARGSWDAVFMLRDINKLRKRYNEMPDGEEKNELIGDVLAIMLEYVCFTSDLTREKISSHLGKYASVAEVSNFITDAMRAINAKN